MLNALTVLDCPLLSDAVLGPRGEVAGEVMYLVDLSKPSGR